MLAAAVLLLALAYVAKAASGNLTHQAGNSLFEQRGLWFDARTTWKNNYAAGSWEVGALLAQPDGTRLRHRLLARARPGVPHGLPGQRGAVGCWRYAHRAWWWVLALAASGGVFQGCYRLFRIK